MRVAQHAAAARAASNIAAPGGTATAGIPSNLTRGIALYRAQDSGQSFRMLFTDEADGPWAPECKRAFTRKKREVLRHSGYEREFVTDLVNEADAVIDVVSLAAR